MHLCVSLAPTVLSSITVLFPTTLSSTSMASTVIHISGKSLFMHQLYGNHRRYFSDEFVKYDCGTNIKIK